MCHTFCLQAKYKVLFNAFVKHEKAHNVISSKNLKPPLRAMESVPDRDYAIPGLKEGQVMRVPLKTSSFAKHPQLPFLRYTYVVAVMKKLRNLDIIPVQISSKEMPNGVSWNNFHRVLHAFHVHYMDYAGYTWAMDISRELLLYLFHGHGPGRVTKRGIKRTPIIAVIHKQLTMGQHLFVKDWSTNFKRLIQHLKDNPGDTK